LTENSTLISVALSVEPPLLHDVLIDLLASQPDIELIDCTMPFDASPPPPDQKAPDVMILSSRHPENDELPLHLLYSTPQCRVLALRNDARTSFLYELRPHRIFLGELSHDALLAAVRRAVGAETE
jgi:DNA-binding NarL/FixJ family response regulator